MKNTEFKNQTLYIVEGHQESALLTALKNRNQCKFSRKRMLELNGKSVSMKALAQKIDDLVKNIPEECNPIIVLFDRESRKETVEEIIAEVKQELDVIGYDTSRFIIGVTDRKIESWMLPFVSEKGKFPVKPKMGFDGESKKGELSRRLKKANMDYHKRTTGVEILLKINARELAEVSESFNQFYRQTKKYCKWFR